MARVTAHEHRNEVRLVGEVARAPEERVLPSGDVVVTVLLRVRVEASRPDRPAPRAESLVCSAWGAAQRRSLAGLVPGDTAEVLGALHRRFWRVPGGAASTSEVVASTVRRLARAKVEGRPSPSRRSA